MKDNLIVIGNTYAGADGAERTICGGSTSCWTYMGADGIRITVPRAEFCAWAVKRVPSRWQPGDSELTNHRR
jgi:hypothetical protein